MTSFSQGIRTARYLYVEHASDEVELYDVREDPGQLENVAGRPAYQGDEEALAATLARLRDCRGGSCSAPMPRRLQG